MDLSGEHRIDADRESVWQALNDPDVLQACIPGCEEVVRTADNEFSARLTAKVGPVKARFSGKVTLSDIDPPNGYTIAGEGTGGPAGFARGSASVALADAPEGGTVLTYQAQGTVGGKLAQIGSRLVDSTARKMAGEFFETFAGRVAPAPAAQTPGIEAPAEGAVEEAPVPETPAAEAPVSEVPATETPAPEVAPADSRGLSPVLWIGGLIAIVLLLLLAFSLWS